MNNRQIIIITLITLVGFLIRIKGTLLGYFAFTYDQGRDMLSVYDIVFNHKLTLIGPTTGLPGIFYGPWWYWFMVPFFMVSGGNPSVIIIAISFLNSLMIPLVFLLSKKIASDSIGVIVAILIAFSPFFIASSVQLWSPNLAPFFTLVSLFLLWMIIQKQKLITFILLGISVGLLQEAEVAYGVLFAISIGIIFAYLAWSSKIKIKAKEGSTILIGFFIIILPRLIFDLRHNFLITRSVINYIYQPKIYQHKLSLIERFFSRIESFFNIFTKTFTSENFALGLVIFLLFSWAIVLFFIKNHKKNTVLNRYILSIIVSLGIFFVAFVVYPDALWEYYLIGLPVIYVVLTVVALHSIKTYYPRFFLPISAILILTSSSPLELIKSFTNVWEGDESVYRNQRRVIDHIYQDAHGQPFSVSVYTPALIDYHYQYLLLWYGNKTYNYLPKEGKKVVYYILEGDKNSGNRNNWLKQHEGDGNIIVEYTIANRITIQKRIRS